MRATTFLFDLDMTLVDSSALAAYRAQGHWSFVMQNLDLVNPLGSGRGCLAHELPGQLRQLGCRVGVVTSSPRPYAMALLTRFGIAHDVLVASGDTELRKPSPQPLRRALELLGASTHETAAIGDDAVDSEAAYHAGIFSIGAGWGRPHFELSSVAPEILLTQVPTAAALTTDLAGLGYLAETGPSRATWRWHPGSLLACEHRVTSASVALGRYFTAGDVRHASHPLSIAILGAKRDPAQMASFAPQMATAVAALQPPPHAVVTVPPRPGEADRFSELKRRLELYPLNGARVVHDGLMAIRAVDGYKNLGAEARAARRYGTIETAHAWNGQRVMVLDDVHTTGATLDECARTLLGGGAASVVAVALGKAQRRFVAMVCPSCGRDMVTRTNRKTGEKFWGCTGYPDHCTRTVSQ